MAPSRRCVLWFAASSLFAQQPEIPTFRTESRFITVDAQVLSHGESVRGLKIGDFLIWDNGRPQNITSFGASDQLLDVLLVVDISGSTERIQQELRDTAVEAMMCLEFRDRVGVAVFNHRAYLAIEPTWDRLKVDQELRLLPPSGGGTELNRTTLYSALYLKKIARPDARRAIVILTDNDGDRGLNDITVLNGLWESDVVVNLLRFPLKYQPRRDSADVRRFVKATGGEVVMMRDNHMPLAELFRRIRERYSLLYRAPEAKDGEIRRIRVELRPEVKAKLPELTIRARSGYRAGEAGSETREKLGPP